MSAPAPAPASPTARALDAAAVAHALRRLARSGQAPWLHAEVARRMAERLSVILRTPQTVIQWWAFLSASDAALQAAYPKARRLLVEPTPDLLQRSAALAARPWWSARRWTTAPVQAVLEEAAPPACGELLWANMMLHAVVDPPALLARWRRVLAVDGFLMFSTFGPDTLSELRALYRAAGWPAPAPAFVDMHDLGDMLVQAGFADPVMDQERLTLTWASPEALLDELRGLGANADPQRTPGLRTPRWRQALLEVLRQRQGADGRIAMTFEIVYGHAFNPAPQARVAARTDLPLEDFRAMLRSQGRSPGPSH